MDGITICVPYRRHPSSKTVKQKKIPEGSHQHDMMKHAAATLGSGNLKLAVQLPEGEDLNEWIAVNSELPYDPIWCAVVFCDWIGISLSMEQR